MTEPNKPVAWLTRRKLIGAGAAAVAVAGATGLGVLLARDGGAIVPGVARARRVVSDQALPDKVDVVVVGGGNVGCMTALTLAERGVRVALCEKGVIAGEASGRSLGYIDNQYLDPIKMPLIGRSKQLWQGLNERVGAETGYRRSGVATFFSDVQGLPVAEAWVASVSGAPGVDARMLTAREARAMATGLALPCVGALYQPSDATAEPQLAAPAMADAIRRHGGFVLQGCAVRGFETATGRISAVITEKGSIPCHAAVIAGGVWSPVLARSIGVDVPQFMAFSYIARIRPGGGPTVATISDTGFAMRQTIDGALDLCMAEGSAPITPQILGNLFRLRPAMQNMWDQLRPVLNLSTFMAQWRIPDRWPLDQPSPFEANRILMPEMRTRFLNEIIDRVQRSVPTLKASQVAERWAGSLMSTLDNMPVISAVREKPGLFFGTGFYYGLTMGPAAGEALADLVMDRSPAFDLAPYRLARFADGSPLVFRA